jgi:hypothetical protein
MTNTDEGSAATRNGGGQVRIDATPLAEPDEVHPYPNTEEECAVERQRVFLAHMCRVVESLRNLEPLLRAEEFAAAIKDIARSPLYSAAERRDMGERDDDFDPQKRLRRTLNRIAHHDFTAKLSPNFDWRGMAGALRARVCHAPATDRRAYPGETCREAAEGRKLMKTRPHDRETQFTAEEPRRPMPVGAPEPEEPDFFAPLPDQRPDETWFECKRRLRAEQAAAEAEAAAQARAALAAQEVRDRAALALGFRDITGAADRRAYAAHLDAIATAPLPSLDALQRALDAPLPAPPPPPMDADLLADLLAFSGTSLRVRTPEESRVWAEMAVLPPLTPPPHVIARQHANAAFWEIVADCGAWVAAVEEVCVEVDRAAWTDRAIPWHVHGVFFLDAIPADLEPAWEALLAMPSARVQRALIRGWEEWEHLPQAALETVRATLDTARCRPADRGKWTAWPIDEPIRYTHVLRAVAWLRGIAEVEAMPPPKTPKTSTERSAKRRAREKATVETLFGDRCRQCLRTRADGIAEFHINHIFLDGGGKNRPGTDPLRKYIIAYPREYGQPPDGLELLCQACHDAFHA